MSVRIGTLILAAALLSGCREIAAPGVGDPVSSIELATGVDATVRWRDIEGGFWALETSDGRRLDPHASLPERFRRDGLAVRVVARPLPDAVCVHMAGQIVEITEIRAR